MQLTGSTRSNGSDDDTCDSQLWPRIQLKIEVKIELLDESHGDKRTRERENQRYRRREEFCEPGKLQSRKYAENDGSDKQRTGGIRGTKMSSPPHNPGISGNSELPDTAGWQLEKKWLSGVSPGKNTRISHPVAGEPHNPHIIPHNFTSYLVSRLFLLAQREKRTTQEFRSAFSFLPTYTHTLLGCLSAHIGVENDLEYLQ